MLARSVFVYVSDVKQARRARYRTVKSIFSFALISTTSWCAGMREGGSGCGSADRGCNAEGCDHTAASIPGMLREGGGGAVSGRRREEVLHRFQQRSGVAMSRGDGRCMYVAPVGVDMSWVWLQTFRWAQRDYKAATRLLQHGKTTPDASDESDREQRACAEGDGGT